MVSMWLFLLLYVMVVAFCLSLFSQLVIQRDFLYKRKTITFATQCFANVNAGKSAMLF